MLSTRIFRFPFLTLVTMRGDWGEFNARQVPMGSTTQAAFELAGVSMLRASHPDVVREVMEAAAGSVGGLRGTARFANVKIDGANLERVLVSRDGIFILNRATWVARIWADLIRISSGALQYITLTWIK